MEEINCAICQKSDYKVLYPASFDLQKINQDIFSARRLPDKVHYQIVKCKNCGLIYSNPILEAEKIEHLYKTSMLTYCQQTEDIGRVYAYYLKKDLKYIPSQERILEVGCGNGFFLEKAKELGFKEVYGIEPSQEAVAKANSEIRQNIKVDIFRDGLFSENYFNAICHFQTFDHLINPSVFLQICHKMLKSKGIVFGINHNIESLFAKILREKCPMIDIEHIYLFSPKTLKKIYEQNGFQVIRMFKVRNNYKLSYWLKLAPLPAKLKNMLMKFVDKTFLGSLKLNVYLGNIGIVARKI